MKIEAMIFNFFFNTIITFWLVFAILWGLKKLFCLNKTISRFWPHTLALLAPFIKVVWDLIHGLPKESVLHLPNFVNFIQNLPPKHGMLIVGAGASTFSLPTINIALSVQTSPQQYAAITPADFIFAWAQFHHLGNALFIFTLFILSIGLFKFSSLVYLFFFRFKKDQFSPLTSKIVYGRKVEVFLDDKDLIPYPYTDSLLLFFHPRIVIPRAIYNKISAQELEGIILHELGHIVHADLLVNFILEVFIAIFWFIPGLRSQQHKIRHQQELNADAYAIKESSTQSHVYVYAQTLIKIHQWVQQLSITQYAKCSLRFTSVFLKERLDHILGLNEKENIEHLHNKHRLILKIGLAIFILGCLLCSRLLGNQPYFH